MKIENGGKFPFVKGAMEEKLPFVSKRNLYITSIPCEKDLFDSWVQQQAHGLVSDTWCKLTYEIENEKTVFIINSEAVEPEKDENDNQKVILVSDEDGTRIEFNRVEGLKTMFLKKKNANLLVERFDSGFYEDLHLLLNEMYELVLTTVDEKLNKAKSGWGNYKDPQTKIRKLSNLCRQSTDQKPI